MTSLATGIAQYCCASQDRRDVANLILTASDKDLDEFARMLQNFNESSQEPPDIEVESVKRSWTRSDIIDQMLHVISDVGGDYKAYLYSQVSCPQDRARRLTNFNNRNCRRRKALAAEKQKSSPVATKCDDETTFTIYIRP
jgi:hypothetical protein